MKAKDILNKLKIMLSLEEEGVEVMASAIATLIDGTEVIAETLEPGSVLMIITEEGQVLAPEGMHETTEGQIITVGENGVIMDVAGKVNEEMENNKEQEEEKMSAETENNENVETQLETEEDKEDKETKMEEDLVKEISDMIKPLVDEIKDLKEELQLVKTKMSEIAEQPATQRIKNSAFKKENNEEKSSKVLEILKKSRTQK